VSLIDIRFSVDAEDSGIFFRALGRGHIVQNCRRIALSPPLGPSPEAAVEAIVADLRGRRGLKWAWDVVDDDVRSEIKAVWAAIIRGKK
jgi:hypothetical protein